MAAFCARVVSDADFVLAAKKPTDAIATQRMAIVRMAPTMMFLSRIWAPIIDDCGFSATAR